MEIRLLGPFEVMLGGRTVPITGNKQRTLLAVLALRPGRSVPVRELAAALWESDPPDSVRRSVQTYVARLRGVLGADRIGTGSGGYQLAIEADAVDALKFLELAERASERDQLAAALRLWRGTPFTQVRSGWLEHRWAGRLTERYLELLRRRADLDLAAGRPGQVVADLTGLVEQHRHAEPLWARLIVALDRRGRPAEALERYETIRRRLADDLGVEPGPELQAIHAALLAADKAEQSRRVQASDRGKGRGGKEAQWVMPRQLPGDVARFVGRKEALGMLDGLLAQGFHGPVLIAALHGSAGVGKTALAVHWAHRVRDSFPDGQLYLDLRGYGPGVPMEPGAAQDTLLRALGVPGTVIPTDLDARGALFRSTLAGRRVLLVLDNARDSSQVLPLLPGASCQVLITSRRQLTGLGARTGAHRITLDTLRPDESVTLLTERLRAHPTDCDPAELAELADLCGHLPLALSIAVEHAMRHPSFELADLIAHLRDRRTRLDALNVPDAATSPRVVFSWSYQGLEPDVARCFRYLGLHPGPDFEPRSIAALLGTPLGRATGLLRVLTDGHLVEPYGPNRYRLHDLLRMYAAELSTEIDPSADRELALTRVYDWYLHSAANARLAAGNALPATPLGPPDPEIEPLTFTDHDQALDWFDRERQVLLALVHDAADRGHHAAAYGTAHMVSAYLRHLSTLDDLLTLQRIAMDAAERAGDQSAVAAAANQLGAVQLRLMNFVRAEKLHQRAVDLYQAVGDDAGRWAALANLGSALRQAGRPADAVLRHRRSIEVARRMGHLQGEAISLNKLAMAYLDLGRYQAAEAACRRSLRLQELSGLLNDEASVTDTLGQALAGQRHYHEAVDAYQRSVALFGESGDPWSQCVVLAHLGVAQRALGQHAEAGTSWSRALELYDQLGATDSAELRRADLVDLLTSVR